MELLFFVTPLIFFLLGYLVKYKRWSFLIAGFNTSSREEKEKYNEEELCIFVGDFLILLGAIAFTGTVGIYFNLKWLSIFSLGMFIIISLLGLIYMNTENRFRY